MPQRSEAAGSEAPGGERYKTMYLLHGFSDDETIWQRRTSIERYVTPLGLAVVMPCAHVSAYADMEHGGNYYSYISKELPGIMRRFFPLSDKREDNYICGLSMGGAGAMKIGLSNTDSFSAIGCLSAGATNDIPNAEVTLKQKQRREMLYGTRQLKDTEEDVFAAAERAIKSGKPLPRIYHTCGSEDFILPAALRTKAFFEAIEGNPFGYVYESDKGVHSWEYWDEHIKHFLDFLQLKPQRRFM